MRLIFWQAAIGNAGASRWAFVVSDYLPCPGQSPDVFRFSPAEQQPILMTNLRSGCDYCVPAHTSCARMAELDKQVIAAICDEQPVSDARREVLRRFTEETPQTRCKVSVKSKREFLDMRSALQPMYLVPPEPSLRANRKERDRRVYPQRSALCRPVS